MVPTKLASRWSASVFSSRSSSRELEWLGKLLCDVHVLGFLNEQNADYHGRECDNDREPQAENLLYFLQRAQSIDTGPNILCAYLLHG
jgi:hypothetical protein